MKYKPFKILIFSILLVFAYIGSTNSEYSMIYKQNIPKQNSTEMETPLIYNIIETEGDTLTFWGLGDVHLEENGTIELVFNGDFIEYGKEQPFFNITFRYADYSINTTFSNVSNGNIAMTLILGFGLWQPGIITHNNWTEQDNSAINVANTPGDQEYSMNGTLDISSEDGIHSYNYTQNITNGLQTTFLQYNETSGILLGWESHFSGYGLKANLQGFSDDSNTNTSETSTSETSTTETNTTTGGSNKINNIPSYPIGALIFVSSLTILIFPIIQKRKKFNESKPKC